ncbi:MAG: VOC family protein [Candidatus Latescibacterota bacterium]|nr:VOC family protein [Candidatus Latescibacterota bacterium]
MSTVLVHIGVRATDLEKTIRFWRDGLSLPCVSTQENCYDLSDGHHNFRVFQHNGPSRPDHVSGMLDYLHIGVQVPDLAAAGQRLLDMGYEIFSDGLDGKLPIDVQQIEEGAFKVEDPDGITVDVTSSDDQWPGAVLK